jgi:hypothetical protein
LLISAPARDGKKHVFSRVDRLPSLIRFILLIGILIGIGWGAMLALVTFVEPQQREMTQTIPASRLTGK